MYGLIGKFSAKPGQRDAFCAAMTASVDDMKGCLSYVVAQDPKDENAIWVTEVWDSVESHKASLEIPAVKATIAKAMPLIAGFEMHQETVPVGGHGI